MSYPKSFDYIILILINFDLVLPLSASELLDKSFKYNFKQDNHINFNNLKINNNTYFYQNKLLYSKAIAKTQESIFNIDNQDNSEPTPF